MAAPTSSGFPTPPASSATPSHHASVLPQPRRHPLKPGGPRESNFIRYMDHGVNSIQKRVDNRLTHRKTKLARGEAEGYRAFVEVAADVGALVDLVWVSGSPNLQTPYLLNLALLAAEFLPLFPMSHRSTQATFRLFAKLDEAFSALLTGHDTATGEALPGFDGGRTMSTTDKVRLKGIVDRTRLTVARALTDQSVMAEESDDEALADVDTGVQSARSLDTVKFQGFEDDDDDDEQDEDWEERNIGGVYEKTIGELGDLGGPPIGIITDDWSVLGLDQQRSGRGSVESDGVMEL